MIRNENGDVLRADLQKAVQAKVDRLNGVRNYRAIPQEELTKGEWYLGESRLAHLAEWDGEFFRTLINSEWRIQYLMYTPVPRDTGDSFMPLKRIPKPKVLEG